MSLWARTQAGPWHPPLHRPSSRFPLKGSKGPQLWRPGPTVGLSFRSGFLKSSGRMTLETQGCREGWVTCIRVWGSMNYSAVRVCLGDLICQPKARNLSDGWGSAETLPSRHLARSRALSEVPAPLSTLRPPPLAPDGPLLSERASPQPGIELCACSAGRGSRRRRPDEVLGSWGGPESQPARTGTAFLSGWSPSRALLLASSGSCVWLPLLCGASLSLGAPGSLGGFLATHRHRVGRPSFPEGLAWGGCRVEDASQPSWGCRRPALAVHTEAQHCLLGHTACLPPRCLAAPRPQASCPWRPASWSLRELPRACVVSGSFLIFCGHVA